MTITMNVEIEKGVSLESISNVLFVMGASIELVDGRVVGNFQKSNCYFVFGYTNCFENVAAEGADASWLVGVEGAFHCRANALSESWEDIKNFHIRLAKQQPLRFVLSFQFETVYATCEGGEVVFVQQMVSPE